MYFYILLYFLDLTHSMWDLIPLPGFEPRSPALQADSLPSEPPETHAILVRFQSVAV